MMRVIRLSKRLRITLLVAVVLLLVLWGAEMILAGQHAPASAVPLEQDNDLSRAAFLAQFGWEISTVPEEVAQVTIPARFDAVYEIYNDLQKAQGFDLTSYQGRSVKRYTYRVLNHPDGGEDVRANLLVADGMIIGGDVCSLALDGFMHGFDRETASALSRSAFYDAVSS